MQQEQLLQVSVFYANDRAGGVGFILENVPVSVIQTFLMAADRDWQEAEEAGDTDEYAHELSRFLVALGQRGSRRNDEDRFHALGAVYLLVKHGYVRDDEYNGILITQVLKMH